MAIRKTKLNQELLLLKSKPKLCVANKITLCLSLQFKTNPGFYANVKEVLK